MACYALSRSCNMSSQRCHSVAGEDRLITIRNARSSNQSSKWEQLAARAPCFRHKPPSSHCISAANNIPTGAGRSTSDVERVLAAELVSSQNPRTVEGVAAAIGGVDAAFVNWVPNPHPAFEAALQVLGDVVAFVKRELYVSFRFVSYDLTSTVLPGTLLTLMTHMKGAMSLPRAPLWRSLPSSFVWMWLYVYVVTLANQTSSGAEDALNKPTRPIPSGVVTVQGGYQRLVWVCSLFVLLGTHLHVGLLSVLWVATVLILNYWGPSCTYLHWLIKPIAMAIGIFIVCVGNPSLVAPIAHHRPTFVYMSAISVSIGLFGSSIQDFRDVEGDRQSTGRSTLPILLGDMPARHLCNFLLLCCWGTLHTALKARSGPYNLATSMVILVWCLCLCYRIFVMRSPAQDHKTYLAFTYLYCFLYLSYSWVA